MELGPDPSFMWSLLSLRRFSQQSTRSRAIFTNAALTNLPEPPVAAAEPWCHVFRCIPRERKQRRSFSKKSMSPYKIRAAVHKLLRRACSEVQHCGFYGSYMWKTLEHTTTPPRSVALSYSTLVCLLRIQKGNTAHAHCSANWACPVSWGFEAIDDR